MCVLYLQITSTNVGQHQVSLFGHCTLPAHFVGASVVNLPIFLVNYCSFQVSQSSVMTLTIQGEETQLASIIIDWALFLFNRWKVIKQTTQSQINNTSLTCSFDRSSSNMNSISLLQSSCSTRKERLGVFTNDDCAMSCKLARTELNAGRACGSGLQHPTSCTQCKQTVQHSKRNKRN